MPRDHSHQSSQIEAFLASAGNWVDHHPGWSVILPLAVGLLTRLLGIVSRPIWYDEAFAVLFAEKGLPAMLIGTLSPTSTGASDVHPLGYYALLGFWMKLFGQALVSVRALSVILSAAALVVIYFLALRLFGAQTARASAILVALSPFQVHYGQEIRMYALLSLWLALATYCFFRGRQSDGWGWWLAFGLFAALAQYTHNLAAFYLLALGLLPVWMMDWRRVRGAIIGGLLAVVLYLPWLVHLPAQFAQVEQSYWVGRPAVYRLLTLLLTYLSNLPLPPPLLGIELFAAVSLIFISLMIARRARVARDGRLREARCFLYLAIAPPLLSFIVSQWKPVYVERSFVASGMAFCLWLAWVLTRPDVRRTERAIALVMLGIGYGAGLYVHLAYAGFPYAPYSAVAASLRSELQRGDSIIHSSKLSLLPTVYYDRTLPQSYVADPAGSTVDTLAPQTRVVLGLDAAPDIEAAVGTAERIWLVLFNESNQEYVRADLGEHPHLKWLRQRYVATGVQAWDGLDVYSFSQKP